MPNAETGPWRHPHFGDASFSSRSRTCFTSGEFSRLGFSLIASFSSISATARAGGGW
jgi:hypothetical protein